MKNIAVTTVAFLLIIQNAMATDCFVESKKDTIAEKKNVFLVRITETSKKDAKGETLENFKGTTNKYIQIRPTWEYWMVERSIPIEKNEVLVLATDDYEEIDSESGVIKFKDPCRDYYFGTKQNAELLKWLRSEEFKTYKPKTK